MVTDRLTVNYLFFTPRPIIGERICWKDWKHIYQGKTGVEQDIGFGQCRLRKSRFSAFHASKVNLKFLLYLCSKSLLDFLILMFFRAAEKEETFHISCYGQPETFSCLSQFLEMHTESPKDNEKSWIPPDFLNVDLDITWGLLFLEYLSKTRPI